MLDLVKRHLPDVTVELTELVSPDQFAALSELRIDLGLVRPPIPEGYASLLVHSEDLVLAVPSGHPLAHDDGAPVALTDVADDYIGLAPADAHSVTLHACWSPDSPNPALQRLVDVLSQERSGGGCEIGHSGR
ncbi:LysR substrate-binding domain-containing protein [Streptomyces asiaticus]